MPRIVIHEVGPRDGLQMEKQVVPLETKEAWIRGVLDAGVDIVQVGSFVHPEKVPQMADTDELFRPARTASSRTGPGRSGPGRMWPRACRPRGGRISLRAGTQKRRIAALL